MQKFLMIAALIMLVIMGCIIFHGYRYQIIKNPNPKYYLTVRGVVSKIRSKNFKLDIQVYYRTNNLNCETSPSYLAGLIEGVYSPRRITKNYRLRVKANGVVRNKIPLDIYKKGYCGWYVDGIRFFMGNEAMQSFIYLIKNQKSTENNTKLFNIWQCQKSYCEVLFPKQLEHPVEIKFNNYDYYFKIDEKN